MALLLLLAGARGEARASGFDERPLSATAAELRRADQAAARGEDPAATTLLDEVVYRVESSGATTTRYRRIVAIDTPAGVERIQTLAASWSPWYEDRPVLQARILDRRDQFHQLDPATVEVGAPPAGGSHMVSDRRTVRAPLPAIAPGSIAEMVITIRERRPLFAAGAVHRTRLGRTTHSVHQTRVVIDAPAGMRLRIDERLLRLAVRRVEQRGARTRWIYEAKALPQFSSDYPVPGDISVFPSVGLSTGASWSEVARAYDAVVRRQIAAGPLPAAARITAASTRRETIHRAAEFVRRELRYTGLELGQNEITPWTPAQVWERRYGDCKDLATFMVALLAGTGIEARVALVSTGPGEDLPVALPGLGTVDHAIVYVPGEKLWIDPTVELARPGQLASHVQGRLAVIASPSTRAPVRIPASRAADNTIIERRRIQVADMGAGSVTEVSSYGGLRELVARYDFRDAPPTTLRKNLEDYVRSSYAARRLARHRVGAIADVSRPFTIDLAAEQAEVAYSEEDTASVWIDITQLFQALPEEFRVTAKPGAPPAGPDRPSPHPRAIEPHVVEWRYVIAIPDGFETISIPPAVERAFGPGTFSQKFALSGAQVRGHLRFTLSRDRITPGEASQLRKGVAELLAAPRPQFRFEHRATRMVAAGDLVRGLAEAKRLVDAAPRSAGRLARFAYVLGESGLARGAVEAARSAVQAAPSASWTHGTLGAALRRDPVGRLDSPGFDRRGAIAALEKAAQLAPDSSYYQIQLGILHSLGDDAVYLGGDLQRAARALEKGRALGDSSDDVRLLQILLRLGETGRLRELADRVEAAGVAGAFRLAGVDKDADFSQALAQIPEASRNEAVQTFKAACLQVGDLDRLRRAFRLARPHVGKAVTDAMVKRLTSVPQGEPRTIEDLFARFAADATVVGGANRWVSRDIARIEGLGSLVWTVPNSRSLALAPGLLPARQLVADLARSTYDVRSFGRAGPVEAIHVKAPGEWSTTRFYVSHEGAGGKDLRMLGVPSAPQFLAPAALRAADAGRLAEARRILDWAAGDPVTAMPPGLAGLQMSRFWNRGERGDLRRIRLAAAGLLVWHEPERSLAILGRECPLARELAEACRFARVAALIHAKRLAEADELLRGLKMEADPSLIGARVDEILRTAAWSDLERLAAGKHTGDNDRMIQYALAVSWVARGQPARARAIADAIRAGPSWTDPLTVNNIAFLYLFVGASSAELSALLPDLERAQQVRPGPHVLHTLATYHAALGRAREARDALHELAVGRVPQPIDQVVVGRIAAAAGLTAIAQRAYREVIEDPSGDTGPDSTAELARRWMSALPPSSGQTRPPPRK